MSIAKSEALFGRAQRVVPRGIFGHCRGGIGNGRPLFFESSEGSRFTDVDGNTYIDWMCAHGPMILGYQHQRVEEAASLQAVKGNTVSLAAPVMIDGGYHGTASWMQATGSAGPVAEDQSLVIGIPWNDLGALQATIETHRGDIACFIS